MEQTITTLCNAMVSFIVGFFNDLSALINTPASDGGSGSDGTRFTSHEYTQPHNIDNKE